MILLPIASIEQMKCLLILILIQFASTYFPRQIQTVTSYHWVFLLTQSFPILSSSSSECKRKTTTTKPQGKFADFVGMSQDKIVASLLNMSTHPKLQSGHTLDRLSLPSEKFQFNIQSYRLVTMRPCPNFLQNVRV